MNASTRREDLVGTSRVQKQLDNPSGDLIPEEVGFDNPMQPQDQVRDDIVVQCACETFIDGAGI